MRIALGCGSAITGALCSGYRCSTRDHPPPGLCSLVDAASAEPAKQPTCASSNHLWPTPRPTYLWATAGSASIKLAARRTYYYLLRPTGYE